MDRTIKAEDKKRGRWGSAAPLWASFTISPLTPVEVHPESVLDVGRTTWWRKLPTIVASGTRSWNTREVVWTGQGEEVGPLRIAEMERAMGYPEGHTHATGNSAEDRHRLIGNAFHAGVLRHLLLC